MTILCRTKRNAHGTLFTVYIHYTACTRAATTPTDVIFPYSRTRRVLHYRLLQSINVYVLTARITITLFNANQFACLVHNNPYLLL